MSKCVQKRPRVCLVGEHGHPDFFEVATLLARDADLSLEIQAEMAPELVIAACSRPGTMARRSVELLRRTAPLAGLVTLLGSWCEGQRRRNRPTSDTMRLYWYEFVPWWQRQLALRAAGSCPDWARPCGTEGPMQPQRMLRGAQYDSLPSAIVLNTPRWETADVLSVLLQRAGFITIWQRPGRAAPAVRGVAAGIWEGGQLDDREAENLTAFCRRLARNAAPVVAMLDFPRRDCCTMARHAGAAAVLGKPWNNGDLLTAIRMLSGNSGLSSAA